MSAAAMTGALRLIQMNTEPPNPSHESIEQFVGRIISELKKPRPKWAKLAIAKVIHLIFTNVPVGRWLEIVEDPERVSELFSETDKPHMLGRIARLMAEIRQIGPEFPLLDKMPWLLTMKYENEQILPTGGRGMLEVVLYEMEQSFQHPPDVQIRFWKGFSNGFNAKLMLRPQDEKAFFIYIFLATNWEAVERCGTIRKVYDFVFSKFPKPACPEGLDPIDFEETHWKWFEKLCNRNLKVQLAKPGRPQELT